jgi:magnesium transporter
MEVFLYRKGADRVEEGFSRDDLPALIADRSNVVWVDLRGETGDQVVEARDVMLNVFGFHPLTVEDCLLTRRHPKIEGFPNYFYFIVHGIKPEETSASNFVTKELDGYLGPNYVVTFHVQRFQSIKSVKDKIRTSIFIPERGAAYLLHNILDELVDLYSPVLEDYEREIGALEDRVFDMKRGTNEILGEIMDLRRSVARLKRISRRQMEVLHRMSHGEFPQVPEHVLPFFRDVHDHLQRMADLAESYRDLVGGLFEIHFAVVGIRTNDIMKTLAVVSAIILPLSLIAGIYGMNFEYLPETKMRYGYFVTLGVMALLTVILLTYFWRRGWIFQGDDEIMPPKAATEEDDFQD